MPISSSSPRNPADPNRPGFPTVDGSRFSHQAVKLNRKVERASSLANALGWFSIGLGLSELFAPRAVAQAAGVRDRPILIRTLGVREVASGVGILSQNKPTGWLWARVAGDAIDLALLGVAVASPQSRRNRIGIAAGAVAGVAILDLFASVQHQQLENAGQLPAAASSPIHVEKCITVNRSADDCYRFWRDFENFPRFMKHLESVSVSDDKRSHWVARGPAGIAVEWDAEITADEEGELLAWSSLEGGDVENAGTVRFERAPGGRGTVVWIDMHYKPPAGRTGAMVARLFGEEPSQQIDEDLRRFKWLIETGEIPTSTGQAAGRRDLISRMFFRKGAPG